MNNLPNKLIEFIEKYTHSENRIIKFIAQAVGFSIVGVMNTLIYLAVYYIVLWINKDLYILGGILGFVVSILNAYYWNSRVVFKAERKEESSDVKHAIKTFITYGSTFLLNIALLYLFVEKLGISEGVAPIINLFITTPINFCLIKFWALKG